MSRPLALGGALAAVLPQGGGGGKEEESRSGAAALTERHVLVHICGSRLVWDNRGIHGPVWRVNAERAGVVFGNDNAETPGGDPQLAERLGRALVRRVRVLESNTNIDEVVGVEIEGLPHREYTGNGDGATFFLTGEGRVTEPQEVYNMTKNSEAGMLWMKQYPQYTAQNLLELGCFNLTGSSFWFVHEEHPAVELMQTNQHELGVHICEEARVEGVWYRVDGEAFMYAIKSLRENLLNDTPSTFNLATLTVKLSKPDRQRWLQLSPLVIDGLVPADVQERGDAESIQAAKVAAIQRYIERPLHVTLRVAFEFVLPDAGEPVGGKAPPSAPPRR